jgi:hypothetical protein
MPHLDDGQIAEWVDKAGATGATGTAGRRADGRTGGQADGPASREIEVHLAGCAVCRERVEEARLITEQASAILASAAPALRPVPPFEEVLHRAGRRRPQATGPVWLRRLAWAATVVMAGGVGWYARDVLQRTTSAPAEQSAAAASRGAAADAAPASPETDAPALQAAAAEHTSTEAKRAQPAAVGGIAAEREAPAPAAAPTAPAVAPSEALRVAGVQDEQRRDAAAPPPAQVAAPMAANEFRVEKAGAPAPWVPTDRATAERELGAPLLLVESLPITSLEIAASGGTVRVTQDLGNGALLELVQEGATGARGGMGATGGAVGRADGRTGGRAVVAVDTVVVRGIRVVAQAPVSPDSLQVLLGRIRR